MAFLPNQQQDPNQPQGQQPGQIPTVPVIPTLQGSSGPTASQSGGSGVTNTATPGGAPSSPWQNVSSYLAANQQGSGNVADVLAGNLTSQYNTANQGIQQANTNFGQQIESARVPYSQQVTDQAKANPSQFVQDPNNVASFQKMYNATYGGPQDFSHSQDYSNLSGQVQKAQQQASLVNQGTPGLMTLLQQAETQGGRNPSQGVTALDSLLLQENPANFAKINAATQPFSGLTDFLGQTQTGLDTAAQNAAKEAAATQSNVQGQFIGPNGVIPNFQQGINDKLQAAQKQAQGYNTNIAGILSSLGGNQRLTQDQEYLLDPSGGYGASYGALQMAQQFPGISPALLAQFYNAPQQIASPTAANVASQDDYANAAALGQLTGQDLGLSGQPGMPFKVPTSIGGFGAQDALKNMFSTLTADQSYLPYMSDQQLSQYPAIYNYIQGLSNGTQPYVPVGQPQPPLPFNPFPPGGDVKSGGGGFHTF